MKTTIKNIICYLYYKYYFKEDVKNSSLYITYYVPGVIKDSPAGTYVFGKINEKTSKIDNIFDIVKYPQIGIIDSNITL